MLFRTYKSQSNKKLTMYNGIFRPEMSLFEGIALIISGTIGAGVLSMPYVMAQSGILIGIAYIIGLGVLMIGLNLMIGEILVRTKGSFQLVGLAQKYLGNIGGMLMTGIMYIGLFGVLVVYIIGEGEALSALFGRTPYEWSLIFFAVASLFVVLGLKTIKTVELLLTGGIFFIIILIAALSSPHVDVTHWQHVNLAHVLLPYGVVLFAFHGATAIPEVHAVLRKKEHLFKPAIVTAGIIVILLYLLFSLVIVGVTGLETTDIATIGLGNKLGHTMFVFGNVFAFFAMATSFLLTGVALKDSLAWDYEMHRGIASLLVLGIPLLLFLFGMRGFIAAIDIVGGVFVSTEVLLLLLIYWKATQCGDIAPKKYKLHHVALLGAVLALVFTFGAVYSVWNLFG